MPLLPDELPPPIKVANRLARRAWDQHQDDRTRLVLEQGSDTIRALMRRNYVLARKLEKAEADAQLMFHLHYGPTKGGGS